MMKASSILTCIQRLTSSFAVPVLRKFSWTASNQHWLTSFHNRPLLASSKGWSPVKSSRDCFGQQLASPFSRCWPILAWPEVTRMLPNPFSGAVPIRMTASLKQMHMRGPHFKTRRRKKPLDGHPFLKGVVLKTLIKKPKKPNSANRRCVLVRLSNGKEAVAHIPGEGHNLQEHNIVLVRVGRLQDVPGVRLKVVRGKYDCAHVIKRTQINS